MKTTWIGICVYFMYVSAKKDLKKTWPFYYFIVLAAYM